MSKRVDDLQPGDEVVIHTGNIHQPYTIGKVEKVTETQITVNGDRYSKHSKAHIGDNLRIAQYRLAETWRDGLMTVEEANSVNQEVAQEAEISRLARQIKDTPSKRFRKLPIDMLRQIVELLEQAN